MNNAMSSLRAWQAMARERPGPHQVPTYEEFCDIVAAIEVDGYTAGTFNFGTALDLLKQGEKVRREGWNGKGMWIALTPGSSFPSEHAKDGHAAKHRAEEIGVGTIDLLPHIDMRAADGSMVIGWLASQTDMLADDWCLV